MAPPERSEPDTAGVLAPAPLIFVPGLLIGLAADYLWPVAVLPPAVQYPGGILLIGLSLVPAGWAMLYFRKEETSFDPRVPSARLITGGPFGLSRNPIYLAMGLLGAGIGILADGIWVILFLALALILTHKGVILREESYLERRFGQDYLDYKSKVRRWL
jgi:protein-S-isoprenylcysteine O-methyltransferase Ste14